MRDADGDLPLSRALALAILGQGAIIGIGLGGLYLLVRFVKWAWVN